MKPGVVCFFRFEEKFSDEGLSLNYVTLIPLNEPENGENPDSAQRCTIDNPEALQCPHPSAGYVSPRNLNEVVDGADRNKSTKTAAPTSVSRVFGSVPKSMMKKFGNIAKNTIRLTSPRREAASKVANVCFDEEPGLSFFQPEKKFPFPSGIPVGTGKSPNSDDSDYVTVVTPFIRQKQQSDCWPDRACGNKRNEESSGEDKSRIVGESGSSEISLNTFPSCREKDEVFIESALFEQKNDTALVPSGMPLFRKKRPVQILEAEPYYDGAGRPPETYTKYSMPKVKSKTTKKVVIHEPDSTKKEREKGQEGRKTPPNDHLKTEHDVEHDRKSITSVSSIKNETSSGDRCAPCNACNKNSDLSGDGGRSASRGRSARCGALKYSKVNIGSRIKQHELIKNRTINIGSRSPGNFRFRFKNKKFWECQDDFDAETRCQYHARQLALEEENLNQRKKTSRKESKSKVPTNRTSGKPKQLNIDEYTTSREPISDKTSSEKIKDTDDATSQLIPDPLVPDISQESDIWLRNKYSVLQNVRTSTRFRNPRLENYVPHVSKESPRYLPKRRPDSSDSDREDLVRVFGLSDRNSEPSRPSKKNKSSKRNQSRQPADVRPSSSSRRSHWDTTTVYDYSDEYGVCFGPYSSWSLDDSDTGCENPGSRANRCGPKACNPDDDSDEYDTYNDTIKVSRSSQSKTSTKKLRDPDDSEPYTSYYSPLKDHGRLTTIDWPEKTEIDKYCKMQNTRKADYIGETRHENYLKPLYKKDKHKGADSSSFHERNPLSDREDIAEVLRVPSKTVRPVVEKVASKTCEQKCCPGENYGPLCSMTSSYYSPLKHLGRMTPMDWPETTDLDKFTKGASTRSANYIAEPTMENYLSMMGKRVDVDSIPRHSKGTTCNDTPNCTSRNSRKNEAGLCNTANSMTPSSGIDVASKTTSSYDGVSFHPEDDCSFCPPNHHIRNSLNTSDDTTLSSSDSSIMARNRRCAMRSNDFHPISVSSSTSSTSAAMLYNMNEKFFDTADQNISYARAQRSDTSNYSLSRESLPARKSFFKKTKDTIDSKQDTSEQMLEDHAKASEHLYINVEEQKPIRLVWELPKGQSLPPVDPNNPMDILLNVLPKISGHSVEQRNDALDSRNKTTDYEQVGRRHDEVLDLIQDVNKEMQRVIRTAEKAGFDSTVFEPVINRLRGQIDSDSEEEKNTRRECSGPIENCISNLHEALRGFLGSTRRNKRKKAQEFKPNDTNGGKGSQPKPSIGPQDILHVFKTLSSELCKYIHSQAKNSASKGKKSRSGNSIAPEKDKSPEHFNKTPASQQKAPNELNSENTSLSKLTLHLCSKSEEEMNENKQNSQAPFPTSRAPFPSMRPGGSNTISRTYSKQSRRPHPYLPLIDIPQIGQKPKSLNYSGRSSTNSKDDCHWDRQPDCRENTSWSSNSSASTKINSEKKNISVPDEILHSRSKSPSLPETVQKPQRQKKQRQLSLRIPKKPSFRSRPRGPRKFSFSVCQPQNALKKSTKQVLETSKKLSTPFPSAGLNVSGSVSNREESKENCSEGSSDTLTVPLRDARYQLSMTEPSGSIKANEDFPVAFGHRTNCIPSAGGTEMESSDRCKTSSTSQKHLPLPRCGGSEKIKDNSRRPGIKIERPPGNLCPVRNKGTRYAIRKAGLEIERKPVPAGSKKEQASCSHQKTATAPVPPGMMNRKPGCFSAPGNGTCSKFPPPRRRGIEIMAPFETRLSDVDSSDSSVILNGVGVIRKRCCLEDKIRRHHHHRTLHDEHPSAQNMLTHFPPESLVHPMRFMQQPMQQPLPMQPLQMQRPLQQSQQLQQQQLLQLQLQQQQQLRQQQLQQQGTVTVCLSGTSCRYSSYSKKHTKGCSCYTGTKCCSSSSPSHTRPRYSRSSWGSDSSSISTYASYSSGSHHGSHHHEPHSIWYDDSSTQHSSHTIGCLNDVHKPPVHFRGTPRPAHTVACLNHDTRKSCCNRDIDRGPQQETCIDPNFVTIGYFQPLPRRGVSNTDNTSSPDLEPSYEKIISDVDATEVTTENKIIEDAVEKKLETQRALEECNVKDANTAEHQTSNTISEINQTQQREKDNEKSLAEASAALGNSVTHSEYKLTNSEIPHSVVRTKQEKPLNNMHDLLVKIRQNRKNEVSPCIPRATVSKSKPSPSVAPQSSGFQCMRNKHQESATSGNLNPAKNENILKTSDNPQTNRQTVTGKRTETLMSNHASLAIAKELENNKFKKTLLPENTKNHHRFPAVLQSKLSESSTISFKPAPLLSPTSAEKKNQCGDSLTGCDESSDKRELNSHATLTNRVFASTSQENQKLPTLHEHTACSDVTEDKRNECYFSDVNISACTRKDKITLKNPHAIRPLLLRGEESLRRRSVGVRSLPGNEEQSNTSSPRELCPMVGRNVLNKIKRLNASSNALVSREHPVFTHPKAAPDDHKTERCEGNIQSRQISQACTKQKQTKIGQFAPKRDLQQTAKPIDKEVANSAVGGIQNDISVADRPGVLPISSSKLTRPGNRKWTTPGTIRQVPLKPSIRSRMKPYDATHRRKPFGGFCAPWPDAGRSQDLLDDVSQSGVDSLVNEAQSSVSKPTTPKQDLDRVSKHTESLSLDAECGQTSTAQKICKKAATESHKKMCDQLIAPSPRRGWTKNISSAPTKCCLDSNQQPAANQQASCACTHAKWCKTRYASGGEPQCCFNEFDTCEPLTCRRYKRKTTNGCCKNLNNPNKCCRRIKAFRKQQQQICCFDDFPPNCCQFDDPCKPVLCCLEAARMCRNRAEKNPPKPQKSPCAFFTNQPVPGRGINIEEPLTPPCAFFRKRKTCRGIKIKTHGEDPRMIELGCRCECLRRGISIHKHPCPPPIVKVGYIASTLPSKPCCLDIEPLRKPKPIEEKPKKPCCLEIDKPIPQDQIKRRERPQPPPCCFEIEALKPPKPKRKSSCKCCCKPRSTECCSKPRSTEEQSTKTVSFEDETKKTSKPPSKATSKSRFRILMTL